MAKGYTPMPRVPADLKDRYEVVTEVLSGAITVSEGARRLGLSRNRFQTLEHRGIEALVQALEAQKGGRPAVPKEERRLREEALRLRRENERLKKRAQTTERILGLARGLIQGRLESGTRKS